MPESITVIKKNIQGRETFRYSGVVLERCPDYIRLEAYFNRDDLLVGEVIFKRNDRFVETYYTTRWYNVFEIYDRDTGDLKAWYCNIGYPAVIEHEVVSYKDLALDLLVYPDGGQEVLDEDEFERLELSPELHRQVIVALDELREQFKNKNKPQQG